MVLMFVLVVVSFSRLFLCVSWVDCCCVCVVGIGCCFIVLLFECEVMFVGIVCWCYL